MTGVGKGSKVDLSTFKKWGKDGVIGYKTVQDGVIAKMVLSGKKRSSRSCPSAKRQLLNEAGNYSFVVTEELSQTSCDESVSDEFAMRVIAPSLMTIFQMMKQTVSFNFKRSQNLTDCVNILTL